MIFSWVPNWGCQARSGFRQTAWPDRGGPNWSVKMNPNDYKKPYEAQFFIQMRWGEKKNYFMEQYTKRKYYFR